MPRDASSSDAKSPDSDSMLSLALPRLAPPGPGPSAAPAAPALGLPSPLPLPKPVLVPVPTLEREGGTEHARMWRMRLARKRGAAAGSLLLRLRPLLLLLLVLSLLLLSAAAGAPLVIQPIINSASPAAAAAAAAGGGGAACRHGRRRRAVEDEGRGNSRLDCPVSCWRLRQPGFDQQPATDVAAAPRASAPFGPVCCLWRWGSGVILSKKTGAQDDAARRALHSACSCFWAGGEIIIGRRRPAIDPSASPFFRRSHTQHHRSSTAPLPTRHRSRHVGPAEPCDALAS